MSISNKRKWLSEASRWCYLESEYKPEDQREWMCVVILYQRETIIGHACNERRDKHLGKDGYLWKEKREKEGNISKKIGWVILPSYEY